MPQHRTKAKELVTLTRERIEEVLGEAVERGHVTVDGAHGIVSALVRRGLNKGKKPRPSGLPVEGYEDLTAAQVKARLSELTPAQLRKVRDYERTHANRKTVLGAVDRRLG